DYDETNKTGGNWKIIHEVTGDNPEDALPAANETEKKYSFTQTTDCYRYFKLNITRIVSGNTMQLGDLALTYEACNHQWVKTDETIAPTCTEGGYDIEKCSLCQATRNVANGTSAKGHEWVSGDTVAPTCTRDGYTPQTCSVCGAKQETDIKDALGHTFDNEICTRCGLSDTTLKEPSKVNNVYQIGTAGELYWFADKVNNDNTNYGSADAVLTADIKVNSNLLSSLKYDKDGNVINGDSFSSWTPIGNELNSYTGTFDGQGFTVSGLYVNNTDSNTERYVGLFGRVASGGKVSKVGVVDSYFNAYKFVGGVCGYNIGGNITECYNKGTVNGNYMYTGGVCGGNNSGTIQNCYNEGSVTGKNERTGGVCGNNDKATIINCYNTGKVVGNISGCGGVCGNNYTDGTIQNCYNIGTVSLSTTVEESAIGGVCGYNKSTITNCYFDSDKYNGTAVGGTGDGSNVSDNVLGKTTEQFNSGEVAYLLSQGENGSVWGQKLGIDPYPVLGGAKVYQVNVYAGCEDNPGDSSTAYSNTNAPVYADHTDEDDDGKCDTCSKYMDNIGARLVGHSLTLDGSVGVNFYMELSSAVISDSSAYMEFTLPGGKTSTVKVSEAPTEEISGTTYHKFKCQVNATAMTDTITAQIKSTVGNSKVYEYTVKEYADYLFEHKVENTEFAKAAELIEAMVNYGSYAQIYAGYNTENLAVGDAKNLKSLDDVWISEYYEPSIYETKVQFAGANLSLLSTTTLRMYFKITDIDAESVLIGYQGQKLEKTQSGDYYYVELVGIPASKLDDEFC
ncbi:MAG: GLUG motif-containing protein, partial [Ruminococcus sp.]